MKKYVTLFVILSLFFSFNAVLCSCSSKDNDEENYDEYEEISDDVTEVEDNDESEDIDEDESEESDDKYAYVEQYLSNFEAIEGNGYTVIVDDSIKDDFTTLKDCAMYTMRKAYEEYGTMDLGVFGHFDNLDNAFAYDSNWEQTIFVYKDNVTPSGWEWELFSQDYEYIKGE